MPSRGKFVHEIRANKSRSAGNEAIQGVLESSELKKPRVKKNLGKGRKLSEVFIFEANAFCCLRETKFVSIGLQALDLRIPLGNNPIVVCRKKAVVERK